MTPTLIEALRDAVGRVRAFILPQAFDSRLVLVGDLEPERPESGLWRITGPRPRLRWFESSSTGVVSARFSTPADVKGRFWLRIDYGSGLGHRVELLPLPIRRTSTAPTTTTTTTYGSEVRLWLPTSVVWLEPEIGPGLLRLSDLTAVRPSGIRRISRACWERWRRQSAKPREKPARPVSPDAEAADDAGRGQAAEPTCSILIVTCNRAPLTRACLDSLARLSGTVSHEIVVVDNGSTDGTRALLEERAPEVRAIFNRENRGFAEAGNQAAEVATGRYLLLLNNDTVVPPDLLERMVSAARSSDRIGAVGAKLIRTDGRLQEAGSILWRDGTALGYGRGSDPEEDEYMFRREVDFASAACLLVPRSVYAEVSGLDADYAPAYYEDVDLCLKIRRTGRVVLFDPFSRVRHEEFGSTDRARAVSLMETNRAKLVEKWASELEGYASPPPPAPPPEHAAAVRRARCRGSVGAVGIFDERLPSADRGAGYPRMYQIVSSLRELGYQVSVSNLVETADDEHHREHLRRQGLEVIRPSKVRRWLARHGDALDVVIVSRPNAFSERLGLVERYAPRARLVYDSEALWYRRVEREARLEPYPLIGYPGAPTRRALAREARRLRRREHRAIRRAEAVIAVSDEDRRDIQLIHPEATAFTIPTIHDRPRCGPDVAPFEGREDLLLVGGFFANPRSPNVDSVLYFLMKIFPRIRAQLPGMRLNVAGNAPPDMLREVAGDAVSFHPDVSVEELRTLYFRARAGVVPQRFGSGIKSKVTEAMSLGLPLVTTTVGAEGTGLEDGASAFITDDPEAFAERVIDLYTQPARWDAIARRAYAIATARFTREAVLPQIRRMMQTLVENG